ncbi:MAG: HepT-like ribonuclease domain-containing protein [bacterium]
MSLEIIQSVFEDIKECVDLITTRFIDINSHEDFTNKPEGMTKLDAITMRLQVVGELIKSVDKKNREFLKNYPQIEWIEIMKLRDIISHHYAEVNALVIFKICKDDIPLLNKTVIQILSEIKKQNQQ